MNATYSPEDNKLRLYSPSRLDAETYARVKAAGFRWASKQGLFVAPMWTPERADLLLDLCGDIGDEDTSLIERAEDRADRFGDYSAARLDDANIAKRAVDAIADHIPLGQPILVGHHSEKHARKDAERIEYGMRKAVKMWETSQYWKDRAAGAIRAAKYKERPDVRARRIKGLEADQRKQQRIKQEAEAFLKAWTNPEKELTLERALKFANYDHIGEVPLKDGSTCWSGWSALQDGKATPEEIRDIAAPRHRRTIARCERWLSHIANRLEYERAMLGESGGIAVDRVKPEKGGACTCWASPRGGWSYVQKVNKVSVTVLDNWGNGGRNFTRTIEFDNLKQLLTKADVDAKRAAGVLVESNDGIGFYLRDTPPAPPAPPAPPREDAQSHAFDAMRATLKAGVQVVSAPQLFPTPPELAQRMVALAGIAPGQRVLEPSAGTAAILNALPTLDGVTAVEINSTLADCLRQRCADVRCADFLECNSNLGTFDRILMNPPFANGQDIKHIEHARHMLKPGGRLVAICANGPRQRENLAGLGEWIDLPEGTFKEQGTNVNTAMLLIDAGKGADDETHPANGLLF